MKTLTGLPYTYIYHAPVGEAASMTLSYPYVNGTAMYTGTDYRGFGGPGTYTSAFGQVTLVSPTKVVTNLTGDPLFFAIIANLTLTFIPEPGTLLLLGPGVAGLAVLGRRRLATRSARSPT